MYFANTLVFKFYFYIKTISLLYFYSFLVACVSHFIAPSYSRRGDWNTAEGQSSIFLVDSGVC